MNNSLAQQPDASRGLAFLVDDARVAAYKEQNGESSLNCYVLDGALVMVKSEAVDAVDIIRLADLAHKSIPAPLFKSNALWVLFDETPFYMGLSEKALAPYTKQYDDYARAASLCI